jgi:hypothetical protein
VSGGECLAVFPNAPATDGLYESFYLRAVHPDRHLGIWIRYTVHKRPGAAPRGSLWFTLFEDGVRPHQQKLTRSELAAPPGSWITVGEASMGPSGADGACGDASWSLRLEQREGELRHLTPGWLYRTPLPRTKLTSPSPAASFSGNVEVAGRAPLRLDGWPGMVGHNWGSQHAERWIWLHGTVFEDEPGAWVDVALARVLLAGRPTPWLVSGALSLDGVRHRLGGLRTLRSTRVEEGASGCTVVLGGEDGLRARLRARVPAAAVAGWRYADPDGSEHDVINCSVAGLELTVRGGSGRERTLRTAAGGAYELGMRERTHGVPIAPFPDG